MDLSKVKNELLFYYFFLPIEIFLIFIERTFLLYRMNFNNFMEWSASQSARFRTWEKTMSDSQDVDIELRRQNMTLGIKEFVISIFNFCYGLRAASNILSVVFWELFYFSVVIQSKLHYNQFWTFLHSDGSNFFTGRIANFACHRNWTSPK